jgi:hypothetical protein
LNFAIWRLNGLINRGPSAPNPIGPIFQRFSPSIDAISAFLAGYQRQTLAIPANVGMLKVLNGTDHQGVAT